MQQKLPARIEGHLPARRLRTDARTDLELMSRWVDTRAKSEHSQRAYRRIGERFLAALPVPLDEADMDHAEAARKAVCTGLAATSAATATAYIKSLLSFAYRRGWTRDNLGEEMKPDAPPPGRKVLIAERLVEPKDIKAIFQHAACRRDRLLLGVLYGGGLRVGEVCRLKWRDVSLVDGRVRLHVLGKGKRERHVYLEPISSAALLKYRGESFNPDAPVFPSREGKSAGGHLSERTVHTMVKRTARRAEVALVTTETGKVTSRFSPHFARHAHASHALANGQTVAMVRDTLGHSSVAVTDAYLHANKTESSAAGLAEDVLRAIEEGG